MVNTFNDILLSSNVAKNFHNTYLNNKAFKLWIDSILPEIEKCANLKQDNPWHIYNCLDHILHSVDEINNLTIGLDYKWRRILAYTMFLHDIGKPECLIRRYSKLYKREVDSFFGHNLASKKIAERVLPSFYFDSEDASVITTLIEEHDMFIFLTLDESDNNPHHHLLTPEYINEKINELNNKTSDGFVTLSLLWCVGRADNKAQNPEMTKNSLILLDRFKYMLCDTEVNNK